MIDKNKIKKVVLAYSGGLDTSIIIPWLKENYDYLQDYKGYDKKESTVKQIRKNMRKCLRQKCIDKPIEKNEQLYTIAYPRLINCYYLKKRIKKKIKRIIAR